MDTTPQDEPQGQGNEYQTAPTEEGRSRTLAPAPAGGNRGPYGRGTYTEWKGSTDVRLAARAIRERWPVSEDKRAALVELLYHEALHGATARDRLYAANALIKADAINVSLAKDGEGKGVTVNIRELVLQAGQQLTSAQTITSPTPLTDKG